MEIKNYILVEILNILNDFANKKLPQKISYAIMKNMDILQREYAIYEKQLKQIFEAYEGHFIKDDKGEIVYNNRKIPLIEDEYSDKFNSEVQELLNTTVEINLYSIDRESFDYNAGDRFDTLTANEMFNLISILCSEEK